MPRPGAQLLVAQHLQIEEPVTQPGKGQAQQQRQQRQSSKLQLSRHVNLSNQSNPSSPIGLSSFLKITGRPWPSVPHPTVTRAAANCLFSSFRFSSLFYVKFASRPRPSVQIGRA